MVNKLATVSNKREWKLFYSISLNFDHSNTSPVQILYTLFPYVIHIQLWSSYTSCVGRNFKEVTKPWFTKLQSKVYKESWECTCIYNIY